MKRRVIWAAAAALLAAPAAFAQQQPASPPAQTQAQAPSQAPGAVDPARLAAARRVVSANGTANSMSVLVSRLIPDLVRPIAQADGLTPEQTALAIRLLSEEMQSSQQDMIELAVQNYARHLSTEDLAALAEFYESPVGRRYIETLPVLLNEGMTAGQAYGRNVLVPRLRERLRALIAGGELQHS